MFLFKNYNLVGNTLYKIGIDEKLHLLHKMGSIPALDANMWDEHGDNIKYIVIRTNRGTTLRIDGNVFETKKQELDLGFGRQYWVEKELWDIRKKELDEGELIQDKLL